MEHALGICGDDNKGTLTPARPDLLFGLVGTKVLQHLSAKEIRARVGPKVYESYFKFAFVRNPYDRAVSTFCIRKKYFSNFKMSFKEFVIRRIAGPPPSRFQRLFQSLGEKAVEDQLETQYDFLHDGSGRLLVDDLGRFETLQKDYRRICERLKIDAELPVMNASARGDYRGYYDAETRSLVARVYRKDFEAFGYEI